MDLSADTLIGSAEGATTQDASPYSIREYRPGDETQILVSNFRDMWLANAVPPQNMKPSLDEISLTFIQEARDNNKFMAFVAEVDGHVAGSTCCQLFKGLYTLVFEESVRRLGYVWGVYVDKSQRGKGIGKGLMTACINYLKSIHCTKAVLHAAPPGKPLYESLGFKPTNEMGLDLV